MPSSATHRSWSGILSCLPIIISRSGDHLLALIDNVLEIARIDAGRVTPTPAPFEVDAMLNDIRLMFDARASKGGLMLDIKHTLDIPYGTVVADRGKISQILINLLGNACKFTHEGGITLLSSVTGALEGSPVLVFQVEDTGEGVAEKDLARIFDPFVQIHGTSSHRAGAGLGLAIAKELARLMGGDLTVKSRIGKGAVFRLEVPVKMLDAPLPGEAPMPGNRVVGITGPAQEYRILVVDDDPANREVLVRMLEPLGFKTAEAKNGREAVERFNAWAPHLILMDVRMPQMDGIAAIRKIKDEKRGRRTPIIGLSASAFTEDRQNVIDSGADDFMAKPIRESDLLDTIGRLLDIRFLRESPASASGQAPGGHGEIGREEVRRLPGSMLNEMAAALQGGYMERLGELTERIQGRQPELARHLLKLIEQYDYEALSRLLSGHERDEA